MRRFHGPLALVALLALSCSSPTGVDGAAGLQVAAVSVDPLASTVVVGGATPLRVAVMDVDGNVVPDAAVVWSVRDAAIATVSATGVVTGRTAGSTQVAASSGGHSAVANITVQRPVVASVLVSPGTASLVVGETTTLSGTARDAAGNALTDRPVAWTSSDVGIATVTTAGMVTAVGPGQAVISGSSEGQTGTATVTVTPVPTASVSVEPANLTLQVGRTTPLTATAKDANGNVLAGRTVSWSTSNPLVATVSPSGVVTAVAPGAAPATITATIEGRTGSASITVALAPVAAIVVSPKTTTLPLGQTTRLGVKITDATGAAIDRPVSWSSNNEGVATVSPSGVVTPVAPGQARITATSEGKSDDAVVTVTRAPVGSVVVLPANSALVVGQTTPLSATVKDARGVVVTDRAVAWKSSNDGVATVSAVGVVTAVAAGSATITATSESQSGTALVSVSVVPVGTVTVSPPTASVAVGQTTVLAATVRDANGTVVTDRPVTWATSNSAVATVSATGVVSAVAVGSATISASTGTKSGSATIIVTPPPVASVAVQPSTLALQVGDTVTLRTVLKDAGGNVLTGRTVTWVSSNALLASVSSTGLVTALAPTGAGMVFITASSEGWNGSASVTITAVPVGSVALPATTTLVAGQSTTLTPVVRDAHGVQVFDRAVTWSSSNQAVATVSPTGVVKSLITGTATITATSEGKSGSTTLTVTPAPVASVTLAPSVVSVPSSSSVTLAATVKDVNGTVVTDRLVTWKSSNEAVAIVSSGGAVTGLAAGTATITATSEGKSGTTTVTVVPGPAAAVTLTPPTASVRDGGSVQLTATAVDANGNAITGRSFTWQASPGSVASVSPSGRVTAKNPGIVTITATLDGKSDTSQITVTP